MRPTQVPASVVLVSLAGLAAGTWWLANRDRDSDQPATAGRTGQPGYYLRDATLEQTDETGRLELRVHAARAVQDPQTRDVRGETLRVDYFLDAPRTWIMTARRGALPPDGQTVLLEGDVRLSGLAGAEGQPAVVHTEKLKLDVDKSIASTREPVRIEFAKHSVNARGLRADLKSDRLRLESNVHGNFTR
jgi:LPS export ABC transporter protein LptC